VKSHRLSVAQASPGAAALSPPLDEPAHGNHAHHAIADISNALGGNPFESNPY
jgi:glutaminase